MATVAKARPGFVRSWQTLSVEVAPGEHIAGVTGTHADSANSGKNHECGHYLTVRRRLPA